MEEASQGVDSSMAARSMPTPPAHWSSAQRPLLCRLRPVRRPEPRRRRRRAPTNPPVHQLQPLAARQRPPAHQRTNPPHLLSRAGGRPRSTLDSNQAGLASGQPRVIVDGSVRIGHARRRAVLRSPARCMMNESQSCRLPRCAATHLRLRRKLVRPTQEYQS
jgi:hypothetical protein